MFKKAVRILLIVLIGLLFGTTVYSANARLVMGEALPMPFGIGVSDVLSGSMEPTLHVDDLAVIRKSDVYAVGDVVVYQSGNSLIIHRIIEIDESEEGTTIITQGDANNMADEPFSKDDIRGKLWFAVPKIGWFTYFMQSLAGKILTIALALFLFERSWNFEKRQSAKEERALIAEIERLKREVSGAPASQEQGLMQHDQLNKGKIQETGDTQESVAAACGTDADERRDDVGDAGELQHGTVDSQQGEGG